MEGSNNIIHFICSRFNLYLKENISKYKWNITEEEWMNKHLDAFEMGLLSSIKNQTCKNFHYICWFDSRTSYRHRNRVDKMKKILPNFYPLYIDLPNDLTGSINNIFFKNAHKQYIKQFCGNNNKIIFQTRVDIDDYIHKRFVEILHENIESYFREQLKNNLKLYQAEQKIKKIISVYFLTGYYVHMDRNPRKFLKVKKKGNQFCTIVEQNNDSLAGLWDIEHIGWKLISNEIVLDIEEPMWIWTIHDNNFGHKQTGRRFKKNDYKLQQEYIPDLFYENFAFNDIYSKKLLNIED